MRFIFIFPIFIFANFVSANSLNEKDLTGLWQPSGEVPRATGINNYTLNIANDLSASYKSLDSDITLNCAFKPSASQASIFVYYCYLGKDHLITLALGGWVSDLGHMQLFGYEYWLGHPKRGDIHGGLPVSLVKKNT